MQTQWDADKNTISCLYSQSQYPNFKQQAKKAGNRESKEKLKLQNWNKGHMQGANEADEPTSPGK